MSEAIEERKPHLIKPGEVRNPNGRPKGSGNRIAERTKAAFAETLEVLDPVALLHDWALNRPELFKDMWKAMLPKNIHVEMETTLTKIAHVIVNPNDNKEIDASQLIEIAPTSNQALDSAGVTSICKVGEELTPAPPMNRIVG